MDYISGWCKSKKRLEGCTVIVTGSNTGIGKVTAMDLYKRGARVIMACRNIDKANDAKKDIEDLTKTEKGTGELIVEELDLCSLRSVREMCARVTSQTERVEALVCNAGVMMCPEARTEDGFETHIGSNHLAHALLALLLLPLMIRSEHARIVFVSSYVHEQHELDLDDLNFEKKPYNAFQAYCRSKAANIMFAKALADKLKENNIHNVKTYSLHPGVIRTEISRHFDEALYYGVRFIFNNVLGWFMKSPLCGAQTTIYCTVDDACADDSGLYYCDCVAKLPSKQCQDSTQVNKLWDETIKALKLNLKNYNPFSGQIPTKDAFM
ncbi:retinol dehydrogenase 13-like [Anticarsia gemmatalis]|uniref:retinol dehydrogenase 13-like n=1 Tax=Anticarsia gemmatalis TaxID=129554 RepID=UPI003F75CA7F